MEWERSIGVANKCTICDLRGAVPNDILKPVFLPNSTDSLCLRVDWMPISRDLAIFVPTTDDREQTKPIALPLAHACRVTTVVRLDR